MFVAVTELQRINRITSVLKAAPIARAKWPVPKTIPPRCFRLQHDCLALDTLQTASTATGHSLDGVRHAFLARCRHFRCVFAALLMTGQRLRNDHPRCYKTLWRWWRLSRFQQITRRLHGVFKHGSPEKDQEGECHHVPRFICRLLEIVSRAQHERIAIARLVALL